MKRLRSWRSWCLSGDGVRPDAGAAFREAQSGIDHAGSSGLILVRLLGDAESALKPKRPLESCLMSAALALVDDVLEAALDLASQQGIIFCRNQCSHSRKLAFSCAAAIYVERERSSLLLPSIRISGAVVYLELVNQLQYEVLRSFCWM